MKKIYYFILITFFFSCLEENSYELPSNYESEPDLTGYTETTFKALVNAYDQTLTLGNQVATFENDLYITGYVVSSDKTGNFFKELIIQNKNDDESSISDPRLGLKLKVNMTALYQSFNFGRKVYIKLNGLSFGKENGVYVLGKTSGNAIDQIQESNLEEHVFRSPNSFDITPKAISISEINLTDYNTYVKISEVQFLKNQLGATYAGESTDEYVGLRTLESCADNQTIQLQTSTFSDFKSVPIAIENGSVNGTLSRDFNDTIDVIIINSPSDISFQNQERCDPEVLECEGETSESYVLFYEDFQDITDENQLDSKGWINLNVNGGNERFEFSSFSGNNFLKISAYGTYEDPLESWLVTPPISLENSYNEGLTFDVSSNFESGRLLSIYITNNFTGNIATTEWVVIDANIPVGDNGFGDFVQSKINVSCLEGIARVAFKYRGAAGREETRYHIDNIKITGKQ